MLNLFGLDESNRSNMAFFSNAKTIAAVSPERAAEADADWALVQRVQTGDVRAFDQLINKYRERLFAIV
jgi:hypothetical protein